MVCDLLIVSMLAVQSPAAAIGHIPTADALRSIDIDVLPDGRGLPAGSGTAEQGKPIYEARCASCHGATGREGPNDPLAGGQGTLASPRPVRTVGSYWPYATTVWDYINRAMPFQQPHSLTANEVYAVTAYVLSLSGIVHDRDVLSQSTLPQVRMPNRDGFIADDRDHEHLPRK
jgi:mono/diheme cytochrome c family protein